MSMIFKGNIISPMMSFSMNWFLAVLPLITNQTLLPLVPLPLLYLLPLLPPLLLLLLPLVLHVMSIAQSKVKHLKIPFGFVMNA